MGIEHSCSPECNSSDILIINNGHEDLIFCWKPLDDEEPIVLEKELLSLFKQISISEKIYSNKS